ncbi:MAG: helix-turn-helix transcriptional regulator [Thaumarchaeota archaeon]|nr:helix-turn-helix transcriptional regulator [Nitrososphaerota archaeon]
MLHREGEKSPPDALAQEGDGLLESQFQEYAESATAFVRRTSARGALSYRGEQRSVKDNVSIAKKVFSKWSVEIILTIYSLKSAGFGDLRRLLPGITSQVLSRKLRDLEGLGFVQREVIRARPAKVRYSLSKKGELLAKIGEPVIIYLRKSVG